MLKFSFETLIGGSQTQNFESEIITSLEKYSKLNDSILSKIANRIKQGQEQNLQKGIDIYGKSVAPKKIPNGNPIFVNKGELLQSIVNNKVSNNEWNVFISAGRSKIAQYLIEGRSNMVPREFFGISESLSNEIDRILEQEYSKL